MAGPSQRRVEPLSAAVNAHEHPRADAMPSGLRTATRFDTVRGPSSGVPLLLSHPDWKNPAPVCFWMHGRTVSKEIDPGRYLRWIRAGIAAVAIDLPGHGERGDTDDAFAMQSGRRSLDVIQQAKAEVDVVLDAVGSGLGGAFDPGLFDVSRVAIGGMSLGGMVTLRRLCDPHTFECAAVEGTTGWLEELYFPSDPNARSRFAKADYELEFVREMDPASNLDGFEPLPLLALHSEIDAIVPWSAQDAFLNKLRARYQEAGADPALIELKTWEETGAPSEHAGFGRFASEAKTIQTDFLTRSLGLG